MDLITKVFLISLVEFVLLYLAYKIVLRYRKEISKLKKDIEALKFKKRSFVIKHGKTLEQFIPFIHDKGYPIENFRMLGSPIDGIYFNDDEVVIVEFKTGQARMTQRELQVKDLVDRKKVRFEEIRVGE